MPDGDDQSLSSQDIQDLQDITSRLPAGHPMQKKISLLLNSQPTQFEKERAPGYRSPKDTEFAKTIGLKPTDIAGVTDAAMLGVGGGGIAKTLAEKGLKATVLPLARGIAGATAGSATGHYLGRFVGMPEAGAAIGGLAGGVLGGFGGSEPVKVPEPEPFPLEATSSKIPIGNTPLPPAPEGPQTPFPKVQKMTDIRAAQRAAAAEAKVAVKAQAKAQATAPSPFAGMTSSATPIGNAQLPPVPSGPMPATGRVGGMSVPPTIEAPETGGPLDVPSQSTGKTSLLSRGRTLVQPGAEPDLNNPTHVKMINDYQTMSGSALRQLATAGDRFAAFVLRHMPRP